VATSNQQLSGFGFPITQRGLPQGVLRFIKNNTAQIVKESIQQILMTVPGERFFNPEWGCRARLLLFEPSAATTKETMQSLVYEALIRWEPRIVLTPDGVTITETYSPKNKYAIDVVYTLKSPGQTSGSQHTTVIY